MPSGSGAAQQVRVGERTIRLTNPDKVLFPGDDTVGPTTKAELVAYYWRIAPVVLPHLAGRIVTRKRWPHGTGPVPGSHVKDQEPFFTKNLDSGTPDWVARAAVVHHEREVTYPLATEDAVLVWCAQMASIELHVPQWRLPADVIAGRRAFVLDGADTHPDRLVVDLDPGPGVGLDECVEVALAAKELLDDVGFASVPVTSGSKGIHLYAALEGVSSAAASAFAAELASSLVAELPTLAIMQMKRDLRESKVFVDHTQNNAAKTTVSPYSVRGRVQPWVAAPRTWEELEAGGLAQLRIEEVLERAEDGDPFSALTPADVAEAGGEAPSPHPAISFSAPEERSAGEGGATPASRSGTTPASRAKPTGTLGRGLSPMLATAHDPFTHADLDPDRWAFEPKWDGYRTLVLVDDGVVRFRGRSGRDLTSEFTGLTELPHHLEDHSAVLDAEIVALSEGRPSFHVLQEHGTAPRPPLRLLVFDVLELDGVDLTGHRWTDRRDVLEALDLPEADQAAIGDGDGGWLVTPLLAGGLDDALGASAAVDGEGVIAKRRDATYSSGRRSHAWVKVKHETEARVVVGGWRPGQGRRAGGIGSLLLGVREPDGGLRYVGKVGTGFTDAELDRLLGVLEPLRGRKNPFTTPVPGPEAKVAVWVSPDVEGEVSFDSWTPDGVLRAARWKGQA
ncbi:ATP-dependent DNA ligase [Serinibacter arcticus]|uniref:DNA ligase (ATP) n=1 Tax=Serinibacter arcticus TaxID=1655435 RepID=A0A2U1ZUN1_9MICO|nr:non-homologous end-joining DNA ligase [Serinibacter arcticus]PWD50663.1 ATP-dependent DNA ligase [Serinibacter arcticus]